MPKHVLRYIFAIAFCVLMPAVTHAEVPRDVAWEDLAPKVEASENPFAKLSREQLARLGDIANTRDRKLRNDDSLSPQELENETKLARKLEQSGIDVNGLLAQRQLMAEQQRKAGNKLNAALDGQIVRMPGYLLPLEFSGKLVSEFLLVPWVGACIHTPPPPPNQIVHVKADKPIEFAGLFAPVWVTGRMLAAIAKTSLYLIDGTSTISIGYTMQASYVENYHQ